MSDFTISYPPDYVFKYRGHRQNPAEHIIDEPQADFAAERSEYIDGEGMLLYYKNIPYPKKGHVFPQALYATNILKKVLINLAKTLTAKEMIMPMIGFGLTWNKRRAMEKALTSFNDTCGYFMDDFIISEGYYCKSAKQVRIFITEFLIGLGIGKGIAERTAEIVSQVFEWDNQYRYRMQDLFSCTTKADMIKNFPKVIGQLVKLEGDREKAINSPVTVKFEAIEKMMRMAWMIPSFRKAIRKGLEAVEFKDWQLDEGDIYHTLLRGDYDYRGLDINTRIGILFALHQGHPPQLIPYKRVENNV